MKQIFLAAAAVSALAFSACSLADSSDSKNPPALGQGTVDWLHLQASGAQASENAQEEAPAVQEKAIKRFMASFDHSIPEFFYNRNTFSSAGGSGMGSTGSSASH